MDCVHARLLLMFARPGASEIAPPEVDLLQGHLDQCCDCRELAQHEKCDEAVLASAMREVPMPDGLQGRILERLGREPRPWPWTWIASAAVVLLAVGLGFGWYMRPLPRLHSDDFLFHPDSQAVSEWFHQKGLKVQLPFDARYLDSAEIVSVQGRLVPKLVYINFSSQPVAVAHVYFISERDFGNVKDFALYVSSLRSNAFQSQKCPEAPGYYFLINYTSGSHENFQGEGGSL